MFENVQAVPRFTRPNRQAHISAARTGSARPFPSLSVGADWAATCFVY